MATTSCKRLNTSVLSSTNSNGDDGTVFIETKGSCRQFAPGDLVRSCSSIETLMGIGGVFGTLNTVQAIWLDSKEPIKTEDVTSALWILSRQIPNLQLCLSRRGMSLWFKRIKNFVVDFEETTEDMMKVYETMIGSRYDLYSGPLWKVKLVLPKQQEKKSFSAVLIFGVQHSITDGTANMRMCRELVSILNQITKGQQIEPKLVPLSPIIDDVIGVVEPRYSFLTKYFCKKFVLTIIKNYHHKSSFHGKIPVPETKKAETKILFDDFTKNETKNLLKMCKAAKITVHSFISTVANFALLTVAQSRSDTVIGRTSIAATHCVNTRRYFDNPNLSDATGCHISFLEEKTKMSLADARDFWGTAMRVNKSVRERLEVQKTPLTILPLLQAATIIFPLNNFLLSKGRKNKTDCHYVTTNMGNLKDMLPEPKEEDNIEITYILRSVSSQLSGNPFILTFHTFRDQFMISIDYYTNKMKEEIAKEFFGVLCQFIRNMTSFNTLEGLKSDLS